MPEPATKKPDLKVVSLEGYAYAPRSRGPRYNPDDLIGRTGLVTYRKMRLDEQVKAVMNFKRDAIFARGWAFKFAPGTKLSDEEQKRRIEDFGLLVRKLSGSFVDGLNCVATGRDFGYSVTEKVYGLITAPDGRLLVGITKLLGRDPVTFYFETDEYGTLNRFYQEMGGKRIDHDPAKFIHYVHNPEFDAYLGRSDLREAYKAWFWKTKMLDHWMVYGERLAGGFAAVSIDAAANIRHNSPEYNALQDVIDNLSASNGIILPPGVLLTMEMPPTTDFYQKTVEFFDLAIARSLLVPNLLGVSHTGQTGAYAQAQTQLEAFFWTLNSDKQRMEAVLNEQLFRDLGDQNWGDGDYPLFEFKELSSEHLRWLVETWSKLATGGAVMPTDIDERRLRELLQMPEREEGAALLAETKGQIEQKYAPKAAVPPQGAEQQPAKQEMSAEQVEGIRAAVVAAMGADGKALMERLAPLLERADKVSKFQAAERAARRVAFSVIEDKQNTIAGRLVQQASQIMARGIATALGDEEHMAKLVDGDASDIADAELGAASKRKLNQVFRDALGEAYTMGLGMARNEIDRARAEQQAQQPETELATFQREEFANLRGKAVSFFDQNAFRMAGNLSELARTIIQSELQLAVKYGKSPPEAAAAVYEALIRKGIVMLKDVLEADKRPQLRELVEQALNDAIQVANVPAYLETLSRTNLFEAMNEARFAEFTDPALQGFVEGLEYSAILDARTTEVCRHMHGRRFDASSELWDQYRPPNHYNCRSVLIPITQIDGWDGVESTPPTVEPQDGFK